MSLQIASDSSRRDEHRDPSSKNELTTEQKLRLRLGKLPPRKMLTFIVVTGEQGEIVVFSEIGEGKAMS